MKISLHKIASRTWDLRYESTVSGFQLKRHLRWKSIIKRFLALLRLLLIKYIFHPFLLKKKYSFIEYIFYHDTLPLFLLGKIVQLHPFNCLHICRIFILWMIVSFHNFLSFLALSNVCFNIFRTPCCAIHIQKIFPSLTFEFNLSRECQIL